MYLFFKYVFLIFSVARRRVSQMYSSLEEWRADETFELSRQLLRGLLSALH